MSGSDGRQKCEAVLCPAARPIKKESRLDKWLFCARLCRTRAAAQDHIEAGRIRLNGRRVQKPGHGLRPDDVLTLALGGALVGRVRLVKVLALAEKRGGAAEARNLYEDMPD